jgi:hypothetical protein
MLGSFDAAVVAVALLVAIIIIWHQKQIKERSKNATFIPGGLPLIGDSITVLRHFDTALEFVR